MKQTQRPLRAGRWGILLLLAGTGLGVILCPAAVTDAAREALIQCIQLVIPSLFPFLVLSSLVISLGYGQALGRRLGRVMGPLFRLQGGCSVALILGLVGGYPVGARTVAQLYQQGQCSREEGERLLLFCNNCGPAFLLSTAGAAVFHSAWAGWLLWLSHVAGALLLGVLLRFTGKREHPHAPPSQQAPPAFSSALTEAVTGSAQAVLNLSAFVVLFAVVQRLLSVSHILNGATALLHHLPLGLSQRGCSALLSGLLELTGGICSLAGTEPTPGALALAAFLLGWGGFSVHCQTMAVVHGSGLSLRRYLPAKLAHGLLAAALAWGLAHLFPAPREIILVSHLSLTSFPVLPVLVAVCWAAIALLLLAGKRGRKSRRNRI